MRSLPSLLAGTNLFASEALAAGVATVLSNNTGHRDLIGRSGAPPGLLDATHPETEPEEGDPNAHCLPLSRQRAVAGRKLLGGGTKAQRAAARRSYGGWGESSIDDLVAALEWAYEQRAEAAAVGRRAAARMAAGGTWARAVENFARALREHGIE